MRSYKAHARPAIFAACLACTAVHHAHAESADRVLRTVTVSGTGSVEVKPDIATVNSGVVSEAATARETMARNNAQMTKVVDGLKAAGIPAKDIKTSALQLNPRYAPSRDGNSAPVVGYTAINQVRVSLRDTASGGDILDQLVQLGANHVNGISFSVSAEEPLRDDARRAAMKNARRRAELYAAAENATLGPVITISESSDFAGPLMVRGLAAATAGHFASPAPIEPGSKRLEATVYLTYELK